MDQILQILFIPKLTDVIQIKQNNELIESSIANLLSEESEIESR